MALRGAKPKPAGQARTRSPRVHDWLDIAETPFTGGPKLPPRRASGQRWSAAIRQRWVSWASMPHCRLWGPSDWEFALDALEIAARFYDSGGASWSTELRYRERVMGTTYGARQGMRIRYVEASSARPSTAVVRLDAYRHL